jgi:hypothetical protein
MLRVFPQSIPSKPNWSTKALALRARLDTAAGLLATWAKFSLPLPPPPTERMTFISEYCCFSWVNARKQPSVPSTGICESAHSSLSYPAVSQDLRRFVREQRVSRRLRHCLSPYSQRNTRQHVLCLVIVAGGLSYYYQAKA